MSGVHSDPPAPQSSEELGPGGFSHPPLLWLWLPGPITAPRTHRGASPEFPDFKQLLGKPEIHLKTSQNSWPGALKTNPQPGHRQCLSKQLQGAAQDSKELSPSLGLQPCSSLAVPVAVPVALPMALTMAVPQGHPCCPTRGWEVCWAPQVRWHFGVHPSHQ